MRRRLLQLCRKRKTVRHHWWGNLSHQFFLIGYCRATIADSPRDEGFQQGCFDQDLPYWSESVFFIWNKDLYVVPLHKTI